MAIEASAYRYLIEALQPSAEAVSGELPFVFVKGPVVAGTEARGALLDFLASVAGDRCARLPPVIGFGEGDSNLFAVMFRLFLDDVTRLWAEAAPVDDTERRRNAELMRLIVDASLPQTVRIVDPTDTISLAFLIFFLETCMHFGWCPNTLECQAKRSAHILFNALKKGSAGQDDGAIPAVLCWLWGAWLMAQKTEGVAERPFEQESTPIWHDYQWNVEGSLRAFSLFHSPGGTMGIVEKSARRMQPFQRLASQTAVGMALDIDEITSLDWTSPEISPIKLKKARGCRGECRAVSPDGSRLTWGTSILIFGDTTYRVDQVGLAPDRPMPRPTISLTLETPGPLVPVAHGFESGAPGERMRLELVENPFGLAPDTLPQTPATRFVLRSTSVDFPVGVQSVIAWKRGRNVTAIDRTNLLGMHDV